MRLLLLSACLVLGSVGLAGAADTIGIVSDPATIPAGYRDDKASGHIIVSTAATGGLPALYIRAFPLKSGNENATIGFPGNGGKGWIELPASTAQKATIPIDVTGLEAAGIYEGQIEGMPQGQSAAAVSTKVIVVHSDPGFAPVIGGSAFKDGQVSFVTSDPSVPATFTAQIPATGRKRDLQVVLKPPLDTLLTASPQSLTVSPGETRVVYLLPSSGMPVGISTGSLTIRDANRSDMSTELFVSATRLRNVDTRTAILFLFVFLGALVSVLLNNIFPVSLANRRTREALTNVEGDIRSCGGVTSALLSALLADSARVRLLNGAFSWYTTTKGEQMQQVATLVKALQENVAMAKDLGEQRLKSNAISVRSSEQADRKLSQAEKALIANKPDLAKKLVDETRILIENASSSAVLNELRTALGTDIDALVAAATPEGKPVPEKRDPYITSLVTSTLPASKARLAGMSESQVLRTERDYYIAWTYINDFEPNAPADSNFDASRAQFVSALRHATTSTSTRMLIELACGGLAAKDIAEALANKKARIDCDSEVVPYQMADYRLVFDNPAMDIDAVRRLCTYKWNFGDNTPAPLSDFCRHFYLSPVEPGAWLGQAAQRIWRRLAEGSSASPAGHKRKIAVVVTPPVGTGAAVTIAGEVTVLPQRPRGFGAIGIEVATFFISFFIAVCAAYGTQYATLPTADTLSVFITAFLFGFGLDQIRDRTATQH